MNLTDPTLGHAQNLADLGQRHVLVVVEREDDFLSLGHAVDGRGQRLAQLFDFVEPAWTLALVGDRLGQGGRFAALAAAAVNVVQRHQTDKRDLRKDLL